MYYIAFVLGLAILTWFFQGEVDKKVNPNRELESSLTAQGDKQVRLKRNANSQYILTGLINGTPVTFLLDTGATQVSIPEQVARSLKLRKGTSSEAITANGSVTVYQTDLKTIEIGDIELFDVRAHINPGMQDDMILLGMSALKHLNMEQTGNILTLTQKKNRY